MHPTTQLLVDLVRLPSVNPMGRPLTGPDYLEHRVTDYLERFFRDLPRPTGRCCGKCIRTLCRSMA